MSHSARIALLLCLGAMLAHPTAVTRWHRIVARLTVYDAESCPFGHCSATGARLRAGRHCAVDPRRIPYGSLILIPGLGERIAVDTGRDVVSAKAARLAGRSAVERDAPVVDIFVETRRDAARLERQLPLFAEVQWIEPSPLTRIKK